ncbi:MAG: four helix bundle protein [Acidimicrobiia bacterium]|nr:four helix bundle protein [Acidimicrobiia bacterium]
MQDYRRLRVWQQSKALTVEVYAITSRFPPHERFGLAAQMRRAAVSLTSNIAEGCGRDTPRELSRFTSIAAGSAHELESQMYNALALGMVDEDSASRTIDAVGEIKAMLFAYRASVDRNG